SSKKVMYNLEKLTPIFETMAQKSVLVAGAGAIGSFICDLCVRNGVKYLAVCDKDFYEADNIPKSSFVIHPDDINKSKAHAIADNLNLRCKEGCSVKGFNIDLKQLGPLAFSEFDYVILALDNLSIKIFMQKLIKLCPEEKPIVLSCGTTGEFSEAMIFVPDGACLRCTIPDSWLLEEDPETVYSCAAKVNYLAPTKTQAVVSTSGIASLKSAVDIDDLLTAHATGLKTFTKSERYTQAPFPAKNGHSSFIAPLSDCPVCSLKPPAEIITLKGSTYHTTLRELLHKISSYYKTDFRLKVHVLEIPKKPTQIYDQFVIKEKCRICGEEFNLFKHSGNIRQNQIICDKCKDLASTDYLDFDNPDVVTTRYFSLDDTPAEILDMCLFELGYPIGCYYEVEEFEQPVITEEICLTELTEDDGEELTAVDNKFFCLNEDCRFLLEK
ncbi:MAG: ThiF family adenylyltransferase, partial [Clostridia bacterium]|nr:ThiF family adenylyltransferase [Clostridia bacterium]